MANRLKSDKKKPNPEKLTEEKVEQVSFKKLIEDERTRKILGAFLLLLSFFLFVAFTSYLFTWAEDQDKVRSHGIGILMPNKLEIANLLGSFGAYISHLFFYEGFGIASYLFCSFFFVSGANLLFSKQIFSIPRNLKYLFTGIIVLSVAFAFILSGAGFSWGGELGNAMSQWLTGFIGKLGTAMLIIVALLSYIIWRFNPVFNVPKMPDMKKILPVKKTGDDLQENESDEGALLVIDPSVKKGKKNQLKDAGVMIPLTTEPEPEETILTLVEKEVVPDPVEENWQRFQPPVAEEANLSPELNLSAGPASDLPLEIKPVAPESEEEEDFAAKVKNLAPYDPVLDLRDYRYPTLDLLENYSGEKIVMDPAELEANKNQIINTLKNY
ncbi:MAG: DNA translocase FtsK 4TM domain-containing protein, partial [Chitinophagaceae bacterium]